MPQIYWWIFAGSLALLIAWLLIERRAYKTLLGLIAVAVVVAVTATSRVLAWSVAWLTGNDIEVKGGDSPLPWGLIALLYVALLAGMAAQYLFLKSERARFRWQVFVKPFLASPVVFLPLLAGLQDQLGDGPWTIARLMLIFVAFQNGFFWKTFFDAQAGKIQVQP